MIKGASPVAKDTPMFDAASGGRQIARFTGNFAPMQLSDLPADPAGGRARLVTSAGTASFRLDGYVAASAIPVFTGRDVPVVAGTVWIASAQQVKLVGAAAGSLTVERTVTASGGQAVRAVTPCDALTLTKGAPVPVAVPGNGRGYLTRGAPVDIHGQPGGATVFSLQSSAAAPQLFWSTETRSGFVHVRARAELAIDGWIRPGDLDALKPGETMDQYIPPRTEVTGAALAMSPPPRIATVTREIPLRARRDGKERLIGAVEVGAEVYVMETIAGWTNLLPKSLYVLPPDDGGFWIPAGDAP